MSRSNDRVQDLFSDLTPEELARLIIMDRLRSEPVLSASERRRRVRGLTRRGRTAYDNYLRRFETLRENVGLLERMALELEKLLLSRDSFLNYFRGVEDCVDEITTGHVSAPLLTDNPNLKPGRPLELTVGGAAIRLGVWGSRQRLPMPPGNGQVFEVDARTVDVADALAKQIRKRARELKAVLDYATTEARTMGLVFVAGWAIHAVNGVTGHDNRGRPRGALWPVEDRWALVWDRIRKDRVTAQRISEDPEHWWAKGCDGDDGDEVLKHFTDLGRQTKD